jgi:uroporphyrinogen-III synthase
MDTAITTLLLTRPKDANARLLELIPDALLKGCEIIENPLIGIRALPASGELTDAQAAIFSSANGVAYAPPGAGRQAFCVGARTAEAAQAAGWQATCAGRDAAELLAYLLSRKPGAPLVHFCGQHHRGEIVEQLRAAGWTAERCVVYAQDLLPLGPAAQAALNGDRQVVAPLFSPRTAAHFANILPGGGDRLRVVAMSPAVAEALPDPLRACTTVAAAPTVEAMARAVEKQLSGNQRG